MDQFSRIATVREDQFQSSESRPQLLDQQFAAVAVLNVGRMDSQCDDQPKGIDDQMALAAPYLLARVVPPRPPFSAVLTDWLSRMPTLGVGSLSALRRTFSRKAL